MCESIDRLLPQWTHKVVIDRADQALFAPFASPRRQLLLTEELLPGFRPLELGRRRVWLRWPGLVVRGWIMQQLAKLAASARLDCEAVILIDSDVLILRAFGPDQVLREGRVDLYHAPGAPSGPPDQSDAWHDVARRALGLGGGGYTGADYIATVIGWSPAVVRAMLTHIEAHAARPWHDVLARPFRFSECVLYGVFCQHVPGPHQHLVRPTTRALSHSSWGHDLSSASGRARFVAACPADKVAVQVQSNLRLPEGVRAALLAALRQQVESPA